MPQPYVFPPRPQRVDAPQQRVLDRGAVRARQTYAIGPWGSPRYPGSEAPRGYLDPPAAPTGYRSSVVTLGIGTPTQDSDSGTGSVTLTVSGTQTGAVAEVPEVAAFLTFDPDRFLLAVAQSSSGATVTPTFSVGTGTITLLDSFAQANLYEITVATYVAGSFTISIVVAQVATALAPSCLLYPIKGQIIQSGHLGLAVFASDSNIGFETIADQATPQAGWTAYDHIDNNDGVSDRDLDTHYLDAPSGATQQQEILSGAIACELGP